MERFVLSFQELPSVLFYNTIFLREGGKYRNEGRWHGIVRPTTHAEL
jgi:hypothetical protein